MDAATIVVFVVIVASGLGLSYWAERAKTDRSAMVGLYLLFGIPGLLLTIWGIAALTFGVSNGPLYLLVGLALAVPLSASVRRLLARVIPIDPSSPIDMCGLILLLTVCAVFSVLLVNIGGDLLETPPTNEMGAGRGDTWGGIATGDRYLPDSDIVASVSLAELGFQAVLELAIAYVAVGWLIRRDLRGATTRLGITTPTWKTVLIALGFLVIAYLAGAVGSVLTALLQPDLSDQIAVVTDELTAEVQYPLGAVILGACAGIGEEALFRGAIQPRFGIVLTSITFALIHSQYGLSWVILGLFLVGVTLGVERKYFGTPAAMITHAMFNVIAVLAQ